MGVGGGHVGLHGGGDACVGKDDGLEGGGEAGEGFCCGGVVVWVRWVDGWVEALVSLFMLPWEGKFAMRSWVRGSMSSPQVSVTASWRREARRATSLARRGTPCRQRWACRGWTAAAGLLLLELLVRRAVRKRRATVAAAVVQRRRVVEEGGGAIGREVQRRSGA